MVYIKEDSWIKTNDLPGNISTIERSSSSGELSVDWVDVGILDDGMWLHGHTGGLGDEEGLVLLISSGLNHLVFRSKNYKLIIIIWIKYIMIP